MSLLIATGSNLTDPIANLSKAKKNLSALFSLIAESRIYQSTAVDYREQPDFFNQVLEFKLPGRQTPLQVMKELLAIENKMGRLRQIPQGPRIIDLDMLFWGDKTIDHPLLQIPHPRLFERSFVVYPLRELPYYQHLKRKYHFASHFSHPSHIISKAKVLNHL